MQLYQSKENKKDDKGDAISDIKTSQSKNITEDPLNGHASDLPKIDESSQTDPVVENGKYKSFLYYIKILSLNFK